MGVILVSLWKLKMIDAVFKVTEFKFFNPVEITMGKHGLKGQEECNSRLINF
jgi:hypothetical protein